MSALRLGFAFGSRVAAGFAIAMVLAIVAPLAFGWKPLSVLSGSMSPSIDTGDVVVDEPIAPADARPGDVVTFSDPQNGERAITHRVRSVRIEGRTAHFVTKGDANNSTERWNAPADGRIGRVTYRVPKAGYALAWSRSKEGRWLLLVLPAALWALTELVRIWRPREVTREAVA